MGRLDTRLVQGWEGEGRFRLRSRRVSDDQDDGWTSTAKLIIGALEEEAGQRELYVIQVLFVFAHMARYEYGLFPDNP